MYIIHTQSHLQVGELPARIISLCSSLEEGGAILYRPSKFIWQGNLSPGTALSLCGFYGCLFRSFYSPSWSLPLCQKKKKIKKPFFFECRVTDIFMLQHKSVWQEWLAFSKPCDCVNWAHLMGSIGELMKKCYLYPNPCGCWKMEGVKLATAEDPCKGGAGCPWGKPFPPDESWDGQTLTHSRLQWEEWIFGCFFNFFFLTDTSSDVCLFLSHVLKWTCLDLARN